MLNERLWRRRILRRFQTSRKAPLGSASIHMILYRFRNAVVRHLVQRDKFGMTIAFLRSVLLQIPFFVRGFFVSLDLRFFNNSLLGKENKLITVEDIARMIDHSILHPTFTDDDLKK